MPYLRGTKRYRGESVPPITLANKVARLQRQVALNSPNPNYFGNSVQLLSTATAPFDFQTANLNVTGEYKASPQFGSEITGDEYYNKLLRLVYTAEVDQIENFRLVVYSPKLADTVFQPSNTRNGFTSLPDPAAFNVYHDEVIHNPNSIQALEWKRTINLRMKKTTVNRSNGITEQGPIKVTVLYKNNVSAEGGTLGYQLVTYDK